MLSSSTEQQAGTDLTNISEKVKTNSILNWQAIQRPREICCVAALVSRFCCCRNVYELGVTPSNNLPTIQRRVHFQW